MSIETKLAEAVIEIRHLRQAIDDEVKERRRDHDELVKLIEWYRTLFKHYEDLKDKDAHIEHDLQQLRPLIEKVTSVLEWRETHIQEVHGDVRAAVKETKKRTWQFWVMIISAIVGALTTAVIGGLIAKYFFK
jgi:chromosome segregation ATPase